MSLKSNLLQLIKERGTISLAEIEDFCHKANYKVSNAEKRLRDLRAKILKGQINPDYDPNLLPIYNDKKTAIIGYEYHHWNGKIEEIIEPEPIYNFNGQLINR